MVRRVVRLHCKPEAPLHWRRQYFGHFDRQWTTFLQAQRRIKVEPLASSLGLCLVATSRLRASIHAASKTL